METKELLDKLVAEVEGLAETKIGRADMAYSRALHDVLALLTRAKEGKI